VSQTIHAAGALGIADRLAAGPVASDDLAAAAGADPPLLYRLLRLLAAVGDFREEPGRRFALTPLGDCLRADAPEPLGPLAANVGQPSCWQPWGHLLHSVRTGEYAFRHVYGMDPWTYRARHPAVGAAFDASTTARSRVQVGAVLAAYDFGRFATVVDVAGGHGALLAAILAEHPGARGVLFDQPHVVAGAGEILGAAGVAGRCEVVGGSFFEAVPSGGDAYLLKSILHDWADAEAIAILRVCRRAMGADGTLLVIEREIGPPNEGVEGKLMDVTMLVMNGGQERAPEEYAALFEAAGFRLARVVPAGAGLSIIEARPI
jgi:hypothetical protein